eukprot:352200-Chlamydomonas_euryale.AAC.2
MPFPVAIDVILAQDGQLVEQIQELPLPLGEAVQQAAHVPWKANSLGPFVSQAQLHGVLRRAPKI